MSQMSPSVLTQVSLAVRQYRIKNAFVMSVIEPEHKLIKIRLSSPYLELLGDGSRYGCAEYACIAGRHTFNRLVLSCSRGGEG